MISVMYLLSQIDSTVQSHELGRAEMVNHEMALDCVSSNAVCAATLAPARLIRLRNMPHRPHLAIITSDLHRRGYTEESESTSYVAVWGKRGAQGGGRR